MGCVITNGILTVCADLRRVGGVRQTVWAFNLADLATPLDPVAIGTNYVSFLPFSTYKSLYRFQGPKFAHSGKTTMQLSDAGNISWMHSVTLRLFNDNPVKDGAVEDLSIAEVGIIIQTNNNEFLMYGIGNGLRATAGDESTGVKNADDPITTITLEGSEKTKAKRFLVNGDLNQTLAYLNGVSI